MPDDDPADAQDEGDETARETVPELVSPRSGKLVILCRMQASEAPLAKAKLEWEGIPCFIRDATMAITHPLVVSEVPLLVDEADLERARQILATPVTDDREGEYVDEDWRCPGCHRKAVDLLPPSRPMRAVRAGCVTMALVPVAIGLGGLVISVDTGRRLEQWFIRNAGLWALSILVLSVILIWSKRTKRCRECGHEWRT